MGRFGGTLVKTSVAEDSADKKSRRRKWKRLVVVVERL